MASPQEGVLPKADWERIQSSLNQPKCTKVFNRQEMVDSNLRRFFSVKERRLKEGCIKVDAAVKRRNQAKEDHFNSLAAEELAMKKLDWQQVIDKSNAQRFHQNGCVRKFNTALLKTLVQKENEVVLDFNRKKQEIAGETKRQYEEEMRCNQEKALRQEQEKARQRQLSNKAVADYNAVQTRKNKQLREEERRQEKEERDRLRGLAELHAQELRHQAEKTAESKATALKYLLEDISSKNRLRESEAEKLITEKRETKRVQSDVKEKIQQRKDCMAEKFRKSQIIKEVVTEKLAVTKKEQASAAAFREESKLAREVAENDAEAAKQQKGKEKKRAAMIESISAHTKKKIQEREQKEKAEQQSNVDWLQAQKKSDRLFLEEKKNKQKRIRKDNILRRDFNFTLIAENQACMEQLKRKEHDAEEKNAEQIAVREKQFQQYVQRELHQAGGIQKNDVQHLLAACTGRHGSILDGEEPNCYCQTTDKPLPRFATDQTRLIKGHQERNSLQLSMVDMKPVRLPPLSRAAKLKSKDFLAAKEVVADRHSSSAEMSQYISNDTGKPLSRLVTSQTRSMKEYKLQLTHKETGEVDLKRTCLPPISNKDSSKTDLRQTLLPPISTQKAPAGQHCLPASAEESHFCAKGRGQLLPRLDTAPTLSAKQYLERNKLQVAYKDISKTDLRQTLLPPISTKKAPAGRCWPPAGVEESHFCANGRGQLLPRLDTAPTLSAKQYLERNKLQVAYKDISKADLRQTLLPPISTQKASAEQHCLPAGVEESRNRTKGTAEPLPRLVTAQTRSIKQLLQRNKLQT